MDFIIHEYGDIGLSLIGYSPPTVNGTFTESSTHVHCALPVSDFNPNIYGGQ